MILNKSNFVFTFDVSSLRLVIVADVRVKVKVNQNEINENHLGPL